MGDSCKTLAKVYGILGAIGSFIAAIMWGKTMEVVHGSIQYERSWILTLAILLGVGLSVTMVSTALYTLGEIYNKLNASMSMDAIKGLESLGKDADTKKMMNQGGWKCPTCNRLNYNYETTCRCGTSK